MQRRLRLCCMLLPLLPLLGGCWDRREIEERANVLATGIDTCEQGPACQVLVSRQIAIPGRIPLGGGSEAGGSKGESVVAFTTPGRDVPDSAHRAQAELNRTINFAHTRVLVFSEAFARRGLGEYLDYLRRIPEARRLMWITVSEGRARDVIRSRPSLERVPALFLNDMIEDAVKSGRLPDVFMGEFLGRISNKGEESIAPIVRVSGLDHPLLSGLAIFRGDKMVGRLSPEELATYMQLRGLRKGSDTIRLVLSGGQKAYLTAWERRSRYKVRQNQGRITCLITIELETDLVHLSPELSSADPKVIALLEREGSQQVVSHSKALIKRLQQDRSDILGVGERVRAYLPRVWRTIDDWPTAFTQVDVQVEARIHIRRTGMART